jgi:WD40 repeat protein
MSSEAGPTHNPSSDPALPRVPEHELVRCVGAGSYGQVWLARSVLGSWRAVKVVHRRLFREDRPYEREYMGVQRFEPLSREDEGFVDILQTGRNDDGGYFYYVMELADDSRTSPGRWDGDPISYEPRTLSRVLAGQERLPLDECVELGLALCRALARLHEAGLIHRDVKPSNVIYVDGRPRLADIGLVVEQSEACSWVGTEGFIPPEGPNSPQADLYSLGKVLYVAMSGLDRADFPTLPMGLGTGPEGRRYMELNAILLRACAAAVGARYATATEMGADLELLKSGRSVRQKQQRASPAVRWTMRALAVGVIAGVVGVWWGNSLRGREEKRGQEASTSAVRTSGKGSAAAAFTAMGMRRLEEEDDSAALLYFCDALSAAEAAGEPTTLHRDRIGAVRGRMPRLASVIDAFGDVFSVDFSPDGRHVATASFQGAVTVWEAETGRRLHGPHAPSGCPVKVRIAPDGRRLLLVPEVRLPAMQGIDKPTGSARVLDLATGLPAEPEVGGVVWGVFSPDGRWLAMVGQGAQMTVRSMEDPSVHFELKAPRHPVSSMSFSPDGALLVTVSSDAFARLWRVPGGELVGNPLPIGAAGMLAEFSPDGRRLSTLAMDNSRNSTLRVWDVPSGTPVMEPQTILAPAAALDFSPLGGRRLLTGSSSGALALWPSGGNAGGPTELRAGKGVCRQWSVSRDGQRVAVGADDGSIRVWNLQDGRPLTPILRQPQAARLIALNGDGSRLLTSSGQGLIRIWELSDAPGELDPIPLPGKLAELESIDAPYPIALTADGARLVFPMERNGQIRPVALDLKRGREISLPLDSTAPECRNLVAGWREPQVAFASRGHTEPVGRVEVVLLRFESASCVRLVLPHPEGVTQMAFTGDDRFLVTLDRTRHVRRWDARSGALVNHAGPPVSAWSEFSISWDGRQISWMEPDNTRVNVAEWEHPEVAVWTMSLPSLLGGQPYSRRPFILSILAADWSTRDWQSAPASSLPASATALAGMQVCDFHPASRQLLTSTDSGGAKVIHLRTQTDTTLTSDSSPQSRPWARFDPTGRFVVMADRDGGVSVRDVASGDPVVPRISHPEGVRWAVLTADGMLLTGSKSNRIRRWQLRPALESAEKLRAQAEVLAGRRLDDRGQLAWLTGSNLVQRLR